MIRSFGGRGGRITSIAHSLDGKRLASTSGDAFDAGRLVVWDLETGAALIDLPAHRLPFPRDIHPRRAEVAIASGDLNERHVVQIRDASTGAVLRAIDAGPEKVLDLAFSPDGGRLAGELGSYDLFEIDLRPGEVRVWDSGTGEVLFALSGHAHPLIAVAWSRDGRWIASAGWDQVVKLWDAETRREIHKLRGHASQSVASRSATTVNGWSRRATMPRPRPGTWPAATRSSPCAGINRL